MRRLASAGVAALVLAACGGSPGGTADRRDLVVVRVVTRGGLAPEASARRQLPRLSVFGDGRVIIIGPTTLEYPGPALPNLQEFRLTREGQVRIVDEARTAGLLDDPPPDYGDTGITEQPTTTVTVRAGGATHRVDVYALNFDEGLTAEQRQNRERLNRFIGLIGETDVLRDVVVAGSTRRYAPTALAVRVQPLLVDHKTEEHDWPLGDLAGIQCAVFRGDHLATVLDAARGAREDVRWLSSGQSYQLVFRPLLPDERGCEDLER